MLANLCAENNYNKIKDEVNNIKSDEGGINTGHLWKLKKKLNPKCRDPPTAMLDMHGNLATSDEAVKALAVETYRKRLENREMKEDLKHIQKERKRTMQAKTKTGWQKENLTLDNVTTRNCTKLLEEKQE